ncbi:MAG TPA: hypothetical protein VHQ94_09780 [Pyrinomonadaceae bacterium]|nr:hypothetical protein [Pyrinomonadaceae bacterium]
MATTKSKTEGGTATPRGDDSSNLLNTFLDGISRYIEQFTGSVKNSLVEGDDVHDIADTLSATLREQFVQLNGFLRAEFDKQSPRAREEVGRILRMTAANGLVERAVPAAGGSITQAKGLGLSGIIKELKKIIRMLLDIFFPNFKPKWLDMLFTLIDELFDLIIRLLFPKLADTLSRHEVNYLRELRATAQLARMNESGGDENGDDD